MFPLPESGERKQTTGWSRPDRVDAAVIATCIKGTLVYTCVLITRRCLAMRSVFSVFFFCVVKAEQEGGVTGGSGVVKSSSPPSLFPLNEILFGGGTQLGNIRTLTVEQKEQLLYICIYIYEFIFLLYGHKVLNTPYGRRLFSPLFHVFLI